VTSRQRLLVRYSVAALVLTAAIIALVVWVERGRAVDTSSGIVDVLARDLPADAPINRFTDATARAGISTRHFPATRTRMLPEDMGSGLAWGDCDGDGFDDLYIVNFAAPLGASTQELAAAAGNALYRNRGDGSFEDAGAAAGVDLRGFGMGAAWGDYDGDGDADLYVTNYGRNALFRNEGGCSFVDVTEEAAVGGGDDFSAGAVWGDYDGDGDLDLYVTNYVVFDQALQPVGTSVMQYGTAVPFTLNPASYQPAANWLFRNDGDGSFTDVAAEAGVANAAGRSLSAAWADWDADGDVDLYVANDISDNAFFLNLGDGNFEDISTVSLTADYRGAMGLAIGDYDRDADLDFFVTHWIAQENALYENHMSVGAEGERLLFTDVADLVGLGATGLDYVGWGTGFFDFDNDGWRDLFVANGHTIEDAADNTRLLPQHMQLFWNRGEEGFFELSEVAGPPFERLLVARGAAVADYDRDGDVDIAVLEHGRGVVLLNNAGTPGNHWLQLDLEQDGGNRRALGATIRVDAAGESQLVSVGGVASYLSQESLTAHFGLGAADVVERVVVRWPGGAEEAFVDIRVDARQVLRRGDGVDPASVPLAAGTEEEFWAAYRAGTAAQRDGNRAAALESYDRALLIRPTHADTLHNLAQLRYARGEVDVAWELLGRLAQIEPRANRAWQQLSRVAGTAQPGWAADYAAADAMIDRALEINPGNSESHLLKARWAAYRGDSTLAETEIGAALGLNPRGAEAYTLALWLAVAAGDSERAEDLRRGAVEAMCGAEEAAAACLGDALAAALSAYWSADGSRRGMDAADGAGAAEHPAGDAAASEEAAWAAHVDLDGDGVADLTALADAAGEPARLMAPGPGGFAYLPHGGMEDIGWARHPREDGPRPVPWRGVFLDDAAGPELILVGGGSVPVRRYVASGERWSERPLSGLPEQMFGAVIAVADWNGDGRADLFLANQPQAPSDGNVTAGTPGTDVVGRIYWRRGVDRFEADSVVVNGPLSAAVAYDFDGDGDDDLVTARALPMRETAVDRLLGSATDEPEAPLLTLWRNDGSALPRDDAALPAVFATIQDLAIQRRGPSSDLPALYVATGGLAPERIEADLLLVHNGNRFLGRSALASSPLRWGRTLRVWRRADGGISALRGGMTPADPRRIVEF